ncbi:GntR family transcriptional regulator [Gordonia otitidis]|uniref:GntR family transcriptional regulator n=1 Tax=Gordonia otitidis (strain DSM 44809 / CCUG 52243 / JCM 12355 / NBRC 100426 / IFM 10032) TaxID=1108044 RepID=H5TUI6_GORO1|nr:GntR family transcriptional regulator [Gordonia otitidis]UEA59948.1 GntR family transcriptional regulator [Gordonia otitidis]GAB37144.1 putative GntR family transcriptional regulator [Gordonia otitidis NBRC 100426]
MELAARLRIDPDADRAPFEQIRVGVIDLVSRGELLVGERLPTVRALAADLDLAPNTVARSYRELEAAGIIETRGRRGSFIRAGSNTTLDDAQRATVEHVAALRAMGIDDATIVDLVRRSVG